MLAVTARASIPQIDELAEEVGVVECGADTWRLDSWLALSQRLNTGADTDPAEFATQVNLLCEDNLGNISSGGMDGQVGEMILAASAGSAIDDFERELRDVLAPTELEASYAGVLAALVDVDRAIPDVPGNDISLEKPGAPRPGER